MDHTHTQSGALWGLSGSFWVTLRPHCAPLRQIWATGLLGCTDNHFLLYLLYSCTFSLCSLLSNTYLLTLVNTCLRPTISHQPVSTPSPPHSPLVPIPVHVHVHPSISTIHQQHIAHPHQNTPKYSTPNTSTISHSPAHHSPATIHAIPPTPNPASQHHQPPTSTTTQITKE